MKRTKIALFLVIQAFYVLIVLLGYSIVEGYSSNTILAIAAGIMFTIVGQYFLYKSAKKQELNSKQHKDITSVGRQVIEISSEEIKKQYKVIKKIGIAIVAAAFLNAINVELMKKYYTPIHGYHMSFSRYNYLRIFFVVLAIGELFFLRTVKGFSYTQADSGSKILKRFTSKSVSLLAGCLSVCIFGMVLFMLAGNSFDFYFFFVLSLIYFWIYFPRYAQMEKWVKKQISLTSSYSSSPPSP